MSRTIVVLRALGLGDFLVAVPALRAIRRHWPDHHVVLACPGLLAPLVELAGCVDSVLPHGELAPLPHREHAPDVAVNMHGAGPQSTRILDRLEPDRRIGHRGHGWPGPKWMDDQHERNRWCRMLAYHGIPADAGDLTLDRPPTDSPAPGAVLVHPGAAFGSKRWSPHRFATVIRTLAADGHRVVLTGSTTERPLAEQVAERSGVRPVVRAGETSVLELAALVAGAALVLCGDTGIAHLTYAFRTPSVVLFGPAPARRWGPPPGPHIALSADDRRRGEPFADDPDPALTGVSANAAFVAVASLLRAVPG